MLRRTLLLAALFLAVGTPVLAQEPGAACTTPDSILVRGNTSISALSVRTDAGLMPGETLNFRRVQSAIRNLYATGMFDDIRIDCAVGEASSQLIIEVRERPVLGAVSVEGMKAVSKSTVEDRVDLLVGRPVDPARVTRSAQRIDSLYEAQGYYLAKIVVDTTVVDGKLNLVYRIEEGRRLAISGIRVLGNERLGDGAIVKAMKTKPEGFWWFRRGDFDDDKFVADLGERIPQLYGQRGFVDFQLVRDTMIVDEARGKALIELTVSEGPRYRVGEFEVVGNQRFSTDEIKRYFPFRDEAPTLTQRAAGLIGRGPGNSNVFDRARWEQATQQVQTAYNNEGYIYARVRPVVERVPTSGDSVHRVNLRWEISEEQPAIINRIEIVGNDYTTEACIRDQLVILPGDVFNQDRLIRSWQSIGNMGFFEAPVMPPDTRTANEQGDVDIVFNVKEKKTGNVNFGASVGQGTGIGGFIGLDQPNLFGQCKRGSLQWQFGRYINDFNLSYTDPSIRQGRLSGTVSAYHTRSRFRIANLGRSTRTGGSLQFGLPLPRSPFTRLFVSYGAERVKLSGEDDELLEAYSRGNSFRSTLGLTATNDTRIDMPFATAGSMRTASAQFNGGPLGGTANFQRYTGEARSYATLGQFGGKNPGSQPIKFVLGLTTRGGIVFGNTGPFFYSQEFALGGTQYGEMLRGYDEFSIEPGTGPVPGTNANNARTQSFGKAFFSTTAEVGVRFNQMFYVNAFYDAGNIWNRPREFDPTRLYRGAGIGLATVTPLGPLGLDWAYGFDRVTEISPGVLAPDPKWQLHFKLGQLF